METIILAGGKGTRMSVKNNDIPKPLVKIGPYPIIYHIMKLYNNYGIKDFNIACGYKSASIKKYFNNIKHKKIKIDKKNKNIFFNGKLNNGWHVKLLNTGLDSLTGKRIKICIDSIKENNLLVTYGDGISNVNIKKLIEFHNQHGRLATITAVRPPSRFGMLELKNNKVKAFLEKPQNSGWINGGFFVLNRGVKDYIKNKNISFEKEPLENLSKDGELMAYKHPDFWQPCDTQRDRKFLIELWNKSNCPWKNYE